jgi:hypothetical protein
LKSRAYSRTSVSNHRSKALKIAACGALGLAATQTSLAQSFGLTLGYPCNQTATAPPGGYSTLPFGPLAACTVTAICPSGSANFDVFAFAYSALACPQDSILNGATDSVYPAALYVRASASALDLNNALIRGFSIADSSCTVAGTTNVVTRPDVCGVVLAADGGGGNPPPDPGCYYGYTDTCFCGGPSCNA